MTLAAINFNALEAVAAPKFAGGNISTIINILVGYLFPTAGLLLLIYLLFGGYQWMFSKGDPNALQKAKEIITKALIGFVIVFVSFWIVQLVGVLLFGTSGISPIRSIFGTP